MITEIDIWRSAHLLIRQHGENAAAEAARRAENLQAAGDRDGWAVWQRIVKAIEALQADTPPAAPH